MKVSISCVYGSLVCVFFGAAFSFRGFMLLVAFRVPVLPMDRLLASVGFGGFSMAPVYSFLAGRVRIATFFTLGFSVQYFGGLALFPLAFLVSSRSFYLGHRYFPHSPSTSSPLLACYTGPLLSFPSPALASPAPPGFL